MTRETSRGLEEEKNISARGNQDEETSSGGKEFSPLKDPKES